MRYNIFFTVLSTGKTYKVYKDLAEVEVHDIIRLQNIAMSGIELNACVRGIFKSGNAQLDGQVGFWDIERSF